MAGDCLGPTGGAAWELSEDRGGEFRPKADVLVGSPLVVALLAPRAVLGVGQALLFGAMDSLWLGQNALALIAFT